VKHSWSVIHYRFQCNAWCTKRRVWMSLESKIPGLLFTIGFSAMPGSLSDGSGCCLSPKISGFYFYVKLFLRHLCMDREENTSSI
jgi:hypothetical protein